LDNYRNLIIEKIIHATKFTDNQEKLLSLPSDPSEFTEYPDK